MARKNRKAGQPNRQAQMQRRAKRLVVNQEHKPVYGPLSENLIYKVKVSA